MITFNAIDVETANEDCSSICQVGIVHVRDGGIEDEWGTLINPRVQFKPWNVRIHGIDEERVRNAPSFPQIYDEVRRRVQGSVLVSHGGIDCTALNRASEKYRLEELNATWLNSMSVAQRAWPSRGKRGYGLKNLAADLNISLRKHHDALEDAKAAAKIMVEACEESKLDIQGWIQKLEQSRTRSSAKRSSLKREGCIGAPLFGETVVFTGDFMDSYGITKAEAADLAAEVGCNVHDDITKKSATMLVVGMIEHKTGKYQKAERFGIKILLAEEFFSLIDSVCQQNASKL